MSDGANQPQRRWRVFAVLAATAALTILDVSKLGVALPAIQETMGGSPSTVQMMLVGYTIAYAAALLPAGRIGDVVARRTVFLLGAGVFLLGSVVCMFAPSVGWLIAGRIVEGLGAGLLMPQVLGLIQRVFPAAERAKPLAALAAITSVTSLLGPVLAGLIMSLAGPDLGWRLLFLVNVVAAAIILPLGFRVIVEPAGERRTGFDLVGSLLLGGAVVLAVTPLSAMRGTEPPSPVSLGVMVAGLLLAGLFVVHAKRRVSRGEEALVDPALFRLPHLPAGVLIAGFMHAAATAGTLIVTIGLQQIGGLDELHTALWMLPSAAASLFGSWVAGRFSATSGGIVAAGTAVGAVGLVAIGFAFAVVPAETLPAWVAALLVLSSFGSGVSAPSNQARTLTLVPPHRSSVAGSLIQFSQRVGSAIGMALALVVYYALFTRPTFAGQPSAGPAVALWAVAGFLAAATAVAVVDMRLRHSPAAAAARA